MKKDCISCQYDKIKEELKSKNREELLKERAVARATLLKDESEKELFEIFNKALPYITIILSILIFGSEYINSPIPRIAQILTGALIIVFVMLVVHCIKRFYSVKKHYKQAKTAQLKLDIIEVILPQKEK